MKGGRGDGVLRKSCNYLLKNARPGLLGYAETKSRFLPIGSDATRSKTGARFLHAAELRQFETHDGNDLSGQRNCTSVNSIRLHSNRWNRRDGTLQILRHQRVSHDFVSFASGNGISTSFRATNARSTCVAYARGDSIDGI